jgi:FkbM family methyltransferase
MPGIKWEISVFVSRWRNRLRYLFKIPAAYRNWWAVVLPKFGVSVVLELRNGLRYLVRPGTTDLAVVNEAAMLDPYLGSGYLTLAKDAVVMDIGANIGDFTMQLARLCPQGQVIAVEPVSEHVRAIAIQTLLNGFENITTMHVALGNQEGQIDIHLEGGHSSAYWGEGATETVRITTLPQLMRELKIDQISLLKLDCEGAEWDILPAAEEVLPRVQQICMEFHCSQGWTPPKLAAWLRERGYQVWHTAGPWNGLLWASRLPSEKLAGIERDQRDAVRDAQPVAAHRSKSDRVNNQAGA